MKPADISQATTTRGAIIKLVHDWIRGGMENTEEVEASIDETIARALSDAYARGLEDAAVVAEEYVWDEHALFQATYTGLAVHRQALEIFEAIRALGSK